MKNKLKAVSAFIVARAIDVAAFVVFFGWFMARLFPLLFKYAIYKLKNGWARFVLEENEASEKTLSIYCLHFGLKFSYAAILRNHHDNTLSVIYDTEGIFNRYSTTQNINWEKENDILCTKCGKCLLSSQDLITMKGIYAFAGGSTTLEHCRKNLIDHKSTLVYKIIKEKLDKSPKLFPIFIRQT